MVPLAVQLNFICKRDMCSKHYLKQQNYPLFNKVDERRRDWVPEKPQGNPDISQWGEEGVILNFVRVGFRDIRELGLM